MLRAGGGKIINIGSILSIFGAALRAGLLREQGRHRAAHQVARHRLGEGQDPGRRGAAGMDRHGARNRRPRARWPERARAGAHAGGTLGHTADLAGIAVFLASAASDFVTGAAIPVDGGYSAT